jgi:methionyl-tRNA formyltransferase
VKLPIKVGFFGDYPWSGQFYKSLMMSEDFEIKFLCHSRKKDVKTYFERARYKTNLKVRCIVFQDVKHELARIIEREHIDVILCVAFSTILKRDLLDTLRVPIINVHPSLLPKWRGPDPIRCQILHCDDLFGVTLHEVVEEVDQGPIIFQKSIEIRDVIPIANILQELHNSCNEGVFSAICDYMNGERIAKKQTKGGTLAPYVQLEDLVITAQDNLEKASRKLVLSEALGYAIVDRKGIRKKIQTIDAVLGRGEPQECYLELSDGFLKVGIEIE